VFISRSGLFTKHDIEPGGLVGFFTGVWAWESDVDSVFAPSETCVHSRTTSGQLKIANAADGCGACSDAKSEAAIEFYVEIRV
jgi:hypothetical protein